jgi:uncharacterized protein YbjQ (UPF0145 family)
VRNLIFLQEIHEVIGGKTEEFSEAMRDCRERKLLRTEPLSPLK